MIRRIVFEEIISRLIIKNSSSRFGAVDRTCLIYRSSYNSWSLLSNLSFIDCKLSIILSPNIHRSMLLYICIFYI
jgi:hypothetical protein